MVTGGEQEQHLDRQTTTPSSSATASSTPKRMATISPPVRPLETVAHEVRKSAEGLRVHGDDGGQKGNPGAGPSAGVCPLAGGWVHA